MRHSWIVGGLLALTVGTGAVSEPNPVAGQNLFQVYCATCHGTEAEGTGPMAEILAVETPDLTALAERNDGVFPVAMVAQKIDGRDPTLAHGGTMPLFGNLFDGPGATMATETGQPMITSQPITDLIAWLQSVQGTN